LALELDSMSIAPISEIVPMETGPDGVIRVGGTRVTLDTVIAAFDEGCTPEEIVQQYPTLELADVYSVIAYYLRQRPALKDYLAHRKAQAGAVRVENEARFDPQGVRDRLLARRSGSGDEV
jgi:uncharacterized protein (DUF433 family)